MTGAVIMLSNGLAVFLLAAYCASTGGPGAGVLLGAVGFFMVVSGLDGLALATQKAAEREAEEARQRDD